MRPSLHSPLELAVYAFGNVGFHGSTYSLNSLSTEAWLGQPFVAGAVSPAKDGYWGVTAVGQTCAFGNAVALQPTGTALSGNWCFDPQIKVSNIVGMAAPDDQGYWQVGADGGIFAFGDAGFYGSMGGIPLNKPIVGMAATGDQKGYWLVASDGGIFAFGDARFQGSMGGQILNRPIVGIAADLSANTLGSSGNNGYWLVASDGGIFAFNAPYYGSMGSTALPKPIVSLVSSGDGLGYLMVGADGGALAFGDAAFQGAASGLGLSSFSSPANAIVSMGGS